SHKAHKVFQLTLQRGLKLDSVTYCALIDGYFHTKQVSETATLFDDMVKMCWKPNVQSYTIMIDGYCNEQKSGQSFCFVQRDTSKKFGS
ncbi:hypothetical protein HN51_022495, partial [Arachis hypogaea]